MLFTGLDLLHPEVTIETEGPNADAEIALTKDNGGLTLALTADKTPVKAVRLTWKINAAPDLLVLRDAWERGYGDLGFLPLSRRTDALPWYFLATNGKDAAALGVMVRPRAFVSFRVTPGEASAFVDCRAGGVGVELGGRRVDLCTFLFAEYPETDPYDALKDFVRRMCPVSGKLPKEPVFGSNDWYYAYGNTAKESVLRDADVQAEVTAGLPVRPFVVTDDGWQKNRCAAPWLPNEKFGDMAALASAVKAKGARPGLWYRPLSAPADAPEAYLLARPSEEAFLDPSHPGVRELLREDLRRFKAWGYELVKHDFSSYDLFGKWGKDMGDSPVEDGDWAFFDRSHTAAETVLSFYELLREETDGMLLLSCNAFSHLTAGLSDIQRVGDDTSGRDWERTKKMGVNSLAFRLPHDGVFYLVDADCVGDVGNEVDPKKTEQWMDLLADSNTALFASFGDPTPERKARMASAYATANRPHTLRPVDWLNSLTPSKWLYDGKEISFSWE